MSLLEHVVQVSPHMHKMVLCFEEGMSSISTMVLDTKNLSHMQLEVIVELASAIAEVTEEAILLQQMSQIK